MTHCLLTYLTLFVVFLVSRSNPQNVSARNTLKKTTLSQFSGTKDQLILLHTLRNLESRLRVETNKLFSRNSGKFVRITEQLVDGMGKAEDKYALLRMESVGFSGQMRLMSPNGSHCLCLSDSGNVKSMAVKVGRDLDRCMFYELQSRGYAVFMSKMNKDWYLGITKYGKTKSAKKTHMRQRATHFLKY